MLVCGTPYCNRIVWDFDARVITVWDLSDRKEDNKLRAVNTLSNNNKFNDSLYTTGSRTVVTTVVLINHSR